MNPEKVFVFITRGRGTGNPGRGRNTARKTLFARRRVR